MSPEDLLKRKELLLGPIFWGMSPEDFLIRKELLTQHAMCNCHLQKDYNHAKGCHGWQQAFHCHLAGSFYPWRHLSTLGPGCLQKLGLSHAQIENQIVSPGKDKTFFIYKGPQPSKPCFLLSNFPHLSLSHISTASS
jgi:hypothetical protein